MDPNVRAWWEGRLELIPELGRLIAEIPVSVFVARREISFLGARAFLVRPHTENDAGISLLLDQLLEPICLQRRAAGHPPHAGVHPCRKRLLVLAYDQIQAPLSSQPIPVFD